MQVVVAAGEYGAQVTAERHALKPHDDGKPGKSAPASLFYRDVLNYWTIREGGV